MHLVLLLVLLAVTTTTFARNLRCPGNLNPREVAANSYDRTKYFLCTDEGMLQEKDCDSGEEFDVQLLVGLVIYFSDLGFTNLRE